MIVMIKNRNCVFFILIASLIFSSCEKKSQDTRRRFYNKKGVLVKRVFFEDSTTIKAEATFKRDTILDGYAKRFNRSGRLVSYMEFQNGKKDGQEIHYYENGKIRKKLWNKSGLMDSLMIKYDSLGTEMEIVKIENGVAVGNSYQYYSNSRIKHCIFYNGEGYLTYRVTYDSLGQKIKEEGEFVPMIIIKSDAHSIYQWKVGEVLDARIYFCACLQNDSSIVELRTNKNVLVERFQLKPNQEVFHFLKKLDVPGEYILYGIQDQKKGMTSSVTFIVN